MKFNWNYKSHCRNLSQKPLTPVIGSKNDRKWNNNLIYGRVFQNNTMIGYSMECLNLTGGRICPWLLVQNWMGIVVPVVNDIIIPTTPLISVTSRWGDDRDCWVWWATFAWSYMPYYHVYVFDWSTCYNTFYHGFQGCMKHMALGPPVPQNHTADVEGRDYHGLHCNYR